ncbi:MAG: hypothetical protein EBU90_25350 [Proteobacteria bacterium]|nr:hypothetical protein [Pseudomonadota bacterium]
MDSNNYGETKSSKDWLFKDYNYSPEDFSIVTNTYRMDNTIIYLENPVKLLDGKWIISGGTNEGLFQIEFNSAREAWEYYFNNNPSLH